MLVAALDDDDRWENTSSNSISSPFSSRTIAPKNFASSSIAPSQKSCNIMDSLLRVHGETERLASRGADLFNREITQGMEEIEALDQKKLEALQKEAKAAKSKESWSSLSLVSQYISGAGTIILGTAIGAWPGYLLIASGVISIGNRILQDTHLLETAVAWYTKSEELQQKIIQRIEIGAFFLQMGVGLAGGVGAWSKGVLSAASLTTASIHEKLASILTTASAVASLAGQFGQRYYEKKMSDIQAELKMMGAKTTVDYQMLSQEIQNMSRMSEEVQKEAGVIGKSIRNLQVPFD